jgi:hypothetical protein
MKRTLAVAGLMIALAACGSTADTSSEPLTAQAPTTAGAPTTAAPTTTAAPEMTPGQANALKKAESYLSFSAFSRAGLIKQLEFEGFSNADATYAIDTMNPDWNEQAVEKAKSYLETSSFSRSGLIQQLEYEGFTPAEAEHGVNATGL